MRNDIKKNLPDGIHQYGERGYWHVWYSGFYRAGYLDKRRAQSHLAKFTGGPVAKIPDPVKPRHGLVPSSNGWAVWFEGKYHGNYTYKLSADQKFKSLKGGI